MSSCQEVTHLWSSIKYQNNLDHRLEQKEDKINISRIKGIVIQLCALTKWHVNCKVSHKDGCGLKMLRGDYSAAILSIRLNPTLLMSLETSSSQRCCNTTYLPLFYFFWKKKNRTMGDTPLVLSDVLFSLHYLKPAAATSRSVASFTCLFHINHSRSRLNLF